MATAVLLRSIRRREFSTAPISAYKTETSSLHGQRVTNGATAKSKSSVASVAAYSSVARNLLEEFFEADQKPDDDKPVVYGRKK